MHNNTIVQQKISFRHKIILILLGLILSIVLIEMGLRTGGFLFSSAQEYRNRISIQQRRAYRIMCLGESTTADGGLNGKYSYPRQLEEILNQCNVGIKFSVVNKGVSGSNTTRILNELERNLNEIKPQMVIVMMGINDEGKHMPWKNTQSSKMARFFNSTRICKLGKLIYSRIVKKAKEIGLYKPKINKEFAILDSNPSPPVGLKGLNSQQMDYYESNEPDEISDIEGDNKKAQQYVKLARHYEYLGEFIQAKIAWKQYISLNPHNNDLLIKAAEFNMNYGDIKYAAQLYKKMLDDPVYGELAYCRLLFCHLPEYSADDQEELLRKAISEKPNYFLLYSELYNRYLYQSKYKQAKEVLQQAAKIWSLLYTQSGSFLGDHNRCLEVAEGLQKTIAQNPKDDKALGFLAILYNEMGNNGLAEEYYKRANKARLEYYNPTTCDNFRKLKALLDRRKIQLVCVQYPMRNTELLRKIFKEENGSIFVDNEKSFKEAIKKAKYNEYFIDAFAGDFGHCTPKGNRLLAENIANSILKNSLIKDSYSHNRHL